jgi:Arc/MetJ family transcription regulator
MPSVTKLGYTFAMRRTTLDIDEDMLAKAREILGTSGIKDTVDEALREIVRREAGRRLIARLKENEDLHNPEIMARAWPRPPIS